MLSPARYCLHFKEQMWVFSQLMVEKASFTSDGVRQCAPSEEHLDCRVVRSIDRMIFSEFPVTHTEFAQALTFQGLRIFLWGSGETYFVSAYGLLFELIGPPLLFTQGAKVISLFIV